MYKLSFAAAVLVGLLGSAWSQVDYAPPCDPFNPEYQQDPSAPTLHTENGYEIFLQIPLYLLLEQNFIDDDRLPELLKYPLNETVFMRVYSDQKSRGAMYGAANHDMFSVMYDIDRMESMVIDYQSGFCDVKPMVFLEEFPWGYFHGHNKFIHVPLPDKLIDLKNFKIKRLENLAMYRGFHNVQRYEGCLNLHDYIVHLLKEIDIIEIPDQIIDAVPDSVAIMLRWYFADSSWEMEDGQYAVTGPVPLAVDLYTAWSEQLEKPKDWFFDVAANATLTSANYHSHYPEHDVFKDLMQIPPGIYCERNKTSADPDLPIFPNQFHVKSESVLLTNASIIYNSEEYYDYNTMKFRYDVTLHRPDRDGPSMISVLQDYENNVVFTIDHDNNKCDMKPIGNGEGTVDDDIVNHLLMLPYEIYDLKKINPVYVGQKHCRGMACHFWTGTKNLTIKAPDGSPTYGIFGVWATTDKWSQNFSSVDPSIMSHFIVQLAVDVISSKTDEVVSVNKISIFDYQLITSDQDLFFVTPEAKFCATVENPADSPDIPKRYEYHGEWSNRRTNTTTPIFLNYDAEWNVIRFDWSPTDMEDMHFRESIVYDMRSSVEYKIDQVTFSCTAKQLPPDYHGYDVEPLGYIWPPELQSMSENNRFKYEGVRKCRTVTCDAFIVNDFHEDETLTMEYEFVSPEFAEVSSDVPGFEIEHSLARIIHHHWIDGEDLNPQGSRSVDIFDFKNMRSVFWEYEVVAPCFADVDYKWIRMYLTATDEEALQHVENDIFRVELMEQIRQNASNITPLRIAELRATVDDDNVVVVEFKLRDRHPEEKYVSINLDDAIQSLETSVMSGGFTVTTLIPSPEGSPAIYEFTAQQSFEVCADTPCSVPSSALPTVKLDIGALVGTVAGSLFGGILVVTLILSFAISRKHNVPVKDLYCGNGSSGGMGTELIDKNDMVTTEME